MEMSSSVPFLIGREAWEEREAATLAPCGCRSALSRGRRHPEAEHPYRTAFQRDRDRIIHSKAFRRLEYKTQVFVYHEGDHYRTRLTHSLEAAQLSRTMARALGLNEELAEAVALAHDLGHPPFGHSGEMVLDSLMRGHGGFEHNRQSLRIVDQVEKRYGAFRGLNLTYEVREGLARHSSEYDAPGAGEWDGRQPTLEAQVVNLADEIAYTNHDLDDGLASGLFSAEDLAGIALWDRFFDEARRDNPTGRPKMWQAHVVRLIINHLVTDAMETCLTLLREYGVDSLDRVRAHETPLVTFSPALWEEHRRLKDFLMEKMYRHYRVLRMAAKAERIITELFTAYVTRIEIIPPAVREAMTGESREKIACDYIAGMTDRFALEEYRRLFDPYTRV
jgi:dGTPase